MPRFPRSGGIVAILIAYPQLLAAGPTQSRIGPSSATGSTLYSLYPAASPPVKADFDGDVGMDDFAHLQSCLTGGTLNPPLPSCQDALLDAGNGYVDQGDVAIFKKCLSGAGVAPGDDCPN